VNSITGALTCPACQAKLRLGYPAELVVSLLTFAFWLLIVFFARFEQPGFWVLVLGVALCLGVVGLLKGLVRMGYILCGNCLVIKMGGRLPPQSSRPLSFLADLLLDLVGYSVLISVVFYLVYIHSRNSP
jgi:hypothetical protein